MRRGHARWSQRALPPVNQLQMPVHLAGQPARRTASPAGGQLALVTADAYSLSGDGDLRQWTLLRSPKMAWDGGEHLDESSLQSAARQQAQTPILFDRYEGMDRPPRGLWLENEERAFADGKLPELRDGFETGAARPLFEKAEQDRKG